MLLIVGLSIASNFWLSDWSNQAALNETKEQEQKNMYLGIYGAFGVLQGKLFKL